MSMQSHKPAPATLARAAATIGPSLSTASTSFVDWGPSVSFTKRTSESSLIVIVLASGFTNTVNAYTITAVRINGTDYTCGQRRCTEASSHKAIAGTREIGGIDAGTYTIQLRARTTAGTMQSNSGDTLSFMVIEAPPVSAQPGIVPRMQGWAANQVPATGSTTTSTSYINRGPSKSIVKKADGTRLIVVVAATGYFTGGGAAATFGININSTDTDVVARTANETSSHKTWAGIAEITGLAAGAYTAQLRMKVSAQTFNWDGSDTFSFMILEVP